MNLQDTKTFPKATWSARKGKAVVLVPLAWDSMSNKGAPGLFKM